MANNCPQCGATLAADAPQGMCPECLLRQGLGGIAAGDGGAEPQDSVAPDGKFTAPAPAELAGRFPELEILELLGQGGFGAVYKVRQKTLDRVVALKLLSPEAAKDATFAERFTREARAMAKLMHPNIVLVFEFGEKDGWYFLLMEFVEGVNLREALQAKQISPVQALAIVPQICDALEYAHEVGVVHRDIKPENILVDKKGRIKIADFGLAKLVGRSPIEITLTATHQIMGTLHYMAPEQIDKPLSVDHRADIYSLGVVFYELLTGELPLGRFKLPSEKAPVDGRLDDVVLKTLEREPESRYQHASEVKTDLDVIARSGDVANRPSKRKSNSEKTAAKQAAVNDRDSRRATEEIHEAVDHVVGPAAAMVILGAVNIALFPLVAAVIIPLVAIGVINDDYFFFLGFCFPAMVQGIIMLVGGISLHRLGSFELSAIAATTCFLPLSPLCFLSIPLGIWSWLVLVKPSVWNAFGNPKRKRFVRQLRNQHTDTEEPALSAARQQLSMLGMTQVVLGVINIVHPFAVLAITALIMSRSYRIEDTLTIEAMVLLPSLPLGVMMLLGGLNMRGPGSYAMAMVGAIAGVVPFSPLWLVSVGIAIWSLLVLRQPEARRIFGRTRMADDVPTTPQTISLEVYQAAKEETTSIGIAMFIMGLVNSLLWVFAIIIVVANESVPGRGPIDDDFYPFIFLAGLLTLPIGIVMMISGRSIRTLGSYRWAMAGAIAALLPLSPLCICTLPVAIWILLVITSPEIKSVFGRQPDESVHEPIPGKGVPRPADTLSDFELAAAQSQVQAPGVGLIFVGLVNLVPAIILSIRLAMTHFGPRAAWEYAFLTIASPLFAQREVVFTDSFAVMSWVVLLLVISMPLAAVLILAGWGMRGLKRYGLAVTASVLAMIPCHPGVVVGLPIGIWSLVVLARSDVRMAFQTRAELADEFDWSDVE